MKIENVNSNKAKFMALYFGQNIFSDSFNLSVYGLNIFRYEFSKGIFLNLKSVKDISEEDLKILSIYFGVPNEDFDIHINSVKGEIIKMLNDFSSTDIFIVDYLRSKGYALPYMDLSVEDLVNYGWIKLIEK